MSRIPAITPLLQTNTFRGTTLLIGSAALQIGAAVISSPTMLFYGTLLAVGNLFLSSRKERSLEKAICIVSSTISTSLAIELHLSAFNIGLVAMAVLSMLVAIYLENYPPSNRTKHLSTPQLLDARNVIFSSAEQLLDAIQFSQDPICNQERKQIVLEMIGKELLEREDCVEQKDHPAVPGFVPETGCCDWRERPYVINRIKRALKATPEEIEQSTYYQRLLKLANAHEKDFVNIVCNRLRDLYIPVTAQAVQAHLNKSVKFTSDKIADSRRASASVNVVEITREKPKENERKGNSVRLVFQATKKKELEDRSIADKFMIGEKSVVLNAVFDGHGGFAVAQFLHQNFSKKLQTMLEQKKSNLSDEAILEAIRDTFIELSIEIDQEPDLEGQGSTVSAMLIIDDVLWAISLGDSAVIAFQKQGENITSIPLTTNANIHSLQLNEDKFARKVRKRGDLPYLDSEQDGPIRVTKARISIAASLGDNYVNTQEGNFKALQRAISIKPQVIKLSMKDISHVLVATDGLFDISSPTFIAQQLQKKKDALEIGQNAFSVYQYLSAKGTDDISLILYETALQPHLL